MRRLDHRLQEESPARKLKKALRELVFFPRLVSKKYARYNIGLREMISSFGDKAAEIAWTQNVKRVNLFIRMPIAIGFMSGALLCYVNAKDLKYQFSQSKIPIELSLNKYKKTPSKWIKFRPERIKVQFTYFLPFAVGYALSMAGSIFLSLNPAFRAEKTIKLALQTQKYLFDNGEPWDVVWTPTGILFYAYNCDPSTVQKNVRFWNSINFKPDDPKTSPRDANIFLIKKAYDLPDSIMLNVMPHLKSKQASSDKDEEVEVPENESVDQDASIPEAEETPLAQVAEEEEALPEVEQEAQATLEEEAPAKKKIVGFEFDNISEADIQAIAKAVKNSNVVFKKRKEHPYKPRPVPVLTHEDVQKLREKGILAKRRPGF